MSWVGGYAVLLAGAVVVGCGSDDGGAPDIADQPLRGMIGAGQPASTDGGRTDYLLSDEETLFATVYFGTYNGCNDLNVPDNQLLLSFPAAPGTYELDSERGATFYVGGENLAATEGVIVVDEITETNASLRLRAVHDDEVYAEGETEIDICPPP